MLSDEEKKAIESFKEENNNDLSRFDDFNSYTQFKVKRDKLIIELIEKQQKEIEELKEENKTQSDCAEPIERTEEMVNMKWVNHRFISKDKIKAKIKECEKEKNIPEEMDFKAFYRIKDLKNIEIAVLESLLEK